MRRWMIVFAVVLVSTHARAEDPPATSGPHPHFADQGTLPWWRTLADAQRAAAGSGKVLFIELGRSSCVNCRALCTTLLPDARIGPRLAALAIGVAADADRPEAAVERLLRAKLDEPRELPFVGFVTPDLQWLGGWSGPQTADGILEVIDAVERHPLLQATSDVVRSLEGLLATARTAQQREDWKAVYKAYRDAERLRGRSALRAELASLAEQARAWAARELDEVASDAAAGGDLVRARRRVLDIEEALAGEPIAAEAKSGLKALVRLTSIRAIEAGPSPARAVAHRTRAEADYRGTRWEALFRPRG